MSPTVNISMLIKVEWRTPEGFARVKEIAQTLDIQPSGQGRTSLSGKMPVAAFEKLFEHSPIQVDPKPPGKNDFGSPGGYIIDANLKVPTPLKTYVEIISLEAPSRRLR